MDPTRQVANVLARDARAALELAEDCLQPVAQDVHTPRLLGHSGGADLQGANCCSNSSSNTLAAAGACPSRRGLDDQGVVLRIACQLRLLMHHGRPHAGKREGADRGRLTHAEWLEPKWLRNDNYDDDDDDDDCFDYDDQHSQH